MEKRTLEQIKAERKKLHAMRWLSENDWKVNKRILGEWAENDPRWVAYLAERAKVRAIYDEACEVLKNYE